MSSGKNRDASLEDSWMTIWWRAGCRAGSCRTTFLFAISARFLARSCVRTRLT